MKDFGEILQDTIDDFEGLNEALDMVLVGERLIESEEELEAERFLRLKTIPIARSMTYARIESIVHNIELLKKCLQSNRPLKNISLQNFRLENLASSVFQTNSKVHYVLKDESLKFDFDDLKQEYNSLLTKLVELNVFIEEYNEIFTEARIITMEEARKRAKRVREAADAEFVAQMTAIKETREKRS